jgi:hypothetical protein
MVGVIAVAGRKIAPLVREPIVLRNQVTPSGATRIYPS